ncbi:MAG TPA: DNA ligase D [Acidobacteriaceae bacterium]|nr:DNA ligase D [Acidobacteriaceae bacterium]
MATKRKSARSSSDLVDAQLERYRSMRDFSVTAEPSGDPTKKPTKKAAAKKAATKSKTAAKAEDSRQTSLPFVIQKHAATRLHYDFRLGWNGVLKSWAVAKGPSYVTSDKRLAVQVEDHPIEYGGFEGIIPKGQYGGGTVMLWDTGTWEPQAESADVDKALRQGSLKFILHGEKLKGKWALIRMGGKAANESKPNWLLIKEHDEYERPSGDPAITEEAPDSVVTDRSLDEIAQNEDHVWSSKGAATQETKAKKLSAIGANAGAPAKKRPSASIPTPAKAAKEKLPAFLPPQLATQADEPPTQANWLHELKLDGYRIQARKDGDKVQLLTRSGLDWTHRMQAIAEAVAELSGETAILDGEVVVLDETGLTSFARLQAAFKEGVKYPLTYFVFDLLHLNRHNLRPLPLEQRKSTLTALLAENSSDTLRLSDHLDADGERVFQKACSLHAEGIVSKLASAPYTSGRTRTWLKIKCALQQEFVIGGFTLPSNGMHGVGALLLGYYEGGKLIYAGRTGTGFTQKTHTLLRNQLEKLRIEKPAFASLQQGAAKDALWVTPKLVADVHFATWTADNLVRQAAFQGLREDKPAKDVRREEAIHLSRAEVRPAARAAHQAKASLAAKAVSRPAKETTHTSADKQKGGAEEHAPIRLTHPEKILDTDSKLTKQQLADYYWQIAEHLLPHILNRPISLVRCPEGSTQPCFFQKHVTKTLPPGIEAVMIRDKTSKEPEPYITISTREALAGLAQMSVLEVHPWGSTNDNLEHPDRIIFDLDPDAAIDWSTLAAAAKEMRTLLATLGLKGFLKSTGGKGLHVVAPIEPEHEWPAVKEFAHNVALSLERRSPDRYLSKMSKAARANKIFIDYLRNERGATAVAPFSPRARAGAPVSVPLDWSELDAATRPSFYVADSGAWKSRLKRDPWKQLPSLKQSLDLDKAAQLLEKARK